MNYSRLSLNERIEIEIKLKLNLSIRSIAKALGRAPSTISREIQKIRKASNYCATTAYYCYLQARKRCAPKKRDKDFKSIKSIDLSFGDDSLILNDKSLSASSTGYLYHSLLIALLLSSLKLEYLRVPRIAIIDGLDSNGIDQDRLKNFQNVIKNQLQQFDDIQHQLFFTTGIVADELKDNIIGRYYFEGEHTLDFSRN